MSENEYRISALRALFDTEVKRIDQVLAEREKQTNLALEASQRAIDKAETEGLRAREAANEWRAAMGDREKTFATVQAHETLESSVDYLRRSMDQGAGRRTAYTAAAGIIATLIAIGIGQIIRQGITAADVSQQIQREAPWNRDKEQVERRIVVLEKQVQQLQVQISKLQDGRR